MPDRHSRPASPSATQRSTSGSHGSPACASSVTCPADSSTRASPREATRTTVPGKPSSATTTLLPPASTSSGSPARSAARTASTSASSSRASTIRAAAPPSRSVVSSLSGGEATASTRPRLRRRAAGSRGAGSNTVGGCDPRCPGARRLRATAGFAVVIVVLVVGWLWLRDSSLVAVERVTVTGASGPDAPRVRSALERAGLDMTTLHVRDGALRTAVEPFAAVEGVTTQHRLPRRPAHRGPRAHAGRRARGRLEPRGRRRRRHAAAHDAHAPACPRSRRRPRPPATAPGARRSSARSRCWPPHRPRCAGACSASSSASRA